MCVDPVTMGYAGLGFQALGAYGQYSSGKVQALAQKYQHIAQAEAQRFQAQQSEAAAQQAMAGARDSDSRSLIAQKQHMEDMEQLRSRQRVAAASSGVDSDFGSSLWAQDSAWAAGLEEKVILQSNFAKERWQFLTRAQDFTTDAALLKVGANNSVAAGNIAYSTQKFSNTWDLLGNVGNLGMNYYKMQYAKTGG